MGQLVQAVRTPVADEDLLAALAAGWKPELGGVPPHAALAVLAAQIALETGHGQQVWNQNLGNYKRSGDLDWMMLKTTERVEVAQPDGTSHLVTTPMTCAFASFADLTSAAQWFIHAQWSHWTAAWNAGVSPGSPEAYAHALYDQKPPYYTGDPDAYARGCRHYFDQYRKLLGGDPAPVIAMEPWLYFVPDVVSTVPPSA